MGKSDKGNGQESVGIVSAPAESLDAAPEAGDADGRGIDSSDEAPDLASDDEAAGVGEPSKEARHANATVPGSGGPGIRRELVKIASLSRTLHVRAALNDSRVKQYAAERDAGDVFPDVHATEDPITGELYLDNGYHRVAMEELRGSDVVGAIIEPGTRQEALLRALRQDRGLKKDRQDWYHAANLMLEDPELCRYSNAAIARLCGNIDPKTVDKLRKQIPAAAVTVRMNSQGKTIDTTAIGKGQGKARKGRSAVGALAAGCKTGEDETREIPESAALVCNGDAEAQKLGTQPHHGPDGGREIPEQESGKGSDVTVLPREERQLDQGPDHRRAASLAKVANSPVEIDPPNTIVVTRRRYIFPDCPDGLRLIREGDRFIGFEPAPTTAAPDKTEPLPNVVATVSEPSIDLQVVALLPTAPAADEVIEYFRGQAPSVTKIAQVVLGDGIHPDEILPAIEGKSIYFALTRRGVSKGTVLASLGYELWAHDQSLPANSDVIIGYGSKSGVDHVARGLTDSSGSLQDVYAFIPQGPQVVQHDIGQPYRYWVRTRRSMAA